MGRRPGRGLTGAVAAADPGEARPRHRIGWSDLAGAPVGVWGMGVEGTAAVRRLAALGVDPVLVDDRPGDPRVLPTDAGGLEALERCRYIVKSPGIPRIRPEVAHLESIGVPVLGGLALWLEEVDRDRVVCVTGTKGKSTTVSVLGHLATGLGLRCFVGGNLGLPPFDPDAPDDVDLWVVETSSYQAADVASSPPVVAVTALDADHLTWHGGLEAYVADKLSLCTQPGADLTVASGEDAALRANAHRLGPRVAWVTAGGDPPAWVTALGLLGRHNDRNARIAQRCLTALGVAGAEDDALLADVAAGFGGLDSRLRVIGEVDGVAFVDDSLSTNVLPTIAALDVFADRPVALLAGGFDRAIDYGPLGAHLVGRAAPTLLLALPSNGDRIAAAVATARAGAATGPEVVPAAVEGEARDWFGAAVARAFAWAHEHGGVVLLSPAAASFDHFADYRDRAAAFAEAMRRCG